jgi:endogenous inhibitor of DNA gyrase (YacG/DUF329 family)
MSSTSDPMSPKPVRCPICRKPAVEAYRPFCSKRCADIDLAKWFSGSYAIAGPADDDESDGKAEADVDDEDGPDDGPRH